MSDVNKIKKWLSDADKLKTVRGRFNEVIKDSHVDKFKLGFNADSRFKAFEANIFFGGYTGTYGSSSVYKFESINDTELAREALIDYCKNNEQQILDHIGDFFISKARASEKDARDQIKADLSILDGLSKE